MRHLYRRPVDGTDRHDERIDHHIGYGYAVIRGAVHDLLRHLEAHVRVLGDPGLVVGNRHHRGAIFLYQRQHRFQTLVLAGDGIHQRLAFVDGEARRQRGDDRGVDGQRHVRNGLHELHGLGEYRRLIGQRDAGVDIEHLGTRGNLRPRVGFDPAEVSRSHFRRQDLAPGRIDALADHDERALEADDDFAGCGADDGVGHEASLLGLRCGSRPGYHGTRPPSTPERSMISGTLSSWR